MENKSTTTLLKSKLAEDCEFDFEDFYRIKSDAENIKWSGFLNAPDKNNFRKWFSEQIKNPKREIYLVYLENNVHAVAFFYIDYWDNYAFNVPSGVLSEFARRGIGTWILQEGARIAKENGYKNQFAMVSDFNIGSAKRFEKLGFMKTSEYDVRDIPLAGGLQKFYKWVRVL
ncbi:MAG: GNAT family N-acetyltransferase [Fibrobacter sp.]|nr:GNAT family N-acetyltransferase [Fibrobacter sp.]